MNTHDEQQKLWNSSAGNAWVDMQETLDQLFRPFEELLSEKLSGAVLDVGCGTGATTLAAARRVGPGQRCVGVDISEPMLAVARARSAREGLQARFIAADAQSYVFERAQFDLVISRFGVMFFEDSVQAFSNLRRAAKSGAGLHFVAWRSPAENPFMTTAARAAPPLVPQLAAMANRPADAPGQFAFSDADRVRALLEQSGWHDMQLQPLDVTCTLPERDLVRYFTQLGPLGLALRELDPKARDGVIATVRAAFEPFVTGATVRFVAACWDVRARA
jgi:ubiquinone/menaquinone biosynthesis C-methylase UbiE